MTVELLQMTSGCELLNHPHLHANLILIERNLISVITTMITTRKEI
jgi:hypothetical protein